MLLARRRAHFLKTLFYYKCGCTLRALFEHKNHIFLVVFAFSLSSRLSLGGFGARRAHAADRWSAYARWKRERSQCAFRGIARVLWRTCPPPRNGATTLERHFAGGPRARRTSPGSARRGAPRATTGPFSKRTGRRAATASTPASRSPGSAPWAGRSSRRLPTAERRAAPPAA